MHQLVCVKLICKPILDRIFHFAMLSEGTGEDLDAIIQRSPGQLLLGACTTLVSYIYPQTLTIAILDRIRHFAMLAKGEPTPTP